MWRNSLHLLNCGINVPEPFGYLLKFKGPSCSGGYFFSKLLLGCDNLGTLALNFTKLNQRLEFEGLIEALAEGVAVLHNRKVIHRDLKWSNIMVHKRKNKFWFIDLESAKLYWFTPGLASLVRDIARFVLNCQEIGINESIIERFLDTYARCRKLTRASLDKPVTSVLRKLREKHQKKYQR
jgi:tRNA A-37 threonylcarbamoyl transferase component Bud32